MINITSDAGSNKLYIRATRGQLINEGIIREGFFQTGAQLKRYANDKILRGIKTGRIYRIRQGNRIKRHKSSAPGETHANLSGALRRSLGWKVSGHYLTFGYGVPKGNNSAAPVYASTIENGGRFIRARPTLRNAVNANIGIAENNFEEAFKRRNNL